MSGTPREPSLRDDILAALRAGPATAAQLGERLTSDASAVRRHLDVLVERGWVAYEDRRAGRGRPRRHYALTEAGHESFPRDYAALLGLLLPRLEGTAGRAAYLDAFAAAAASLASPLPRAASMEDRLAALAGLYGRLGFEASLERTSGGHAIVQRNCPFLQTARADPEAMCECLDEGIMRQVLPEAKIRLEDCMATGDTLCRHTITAPTPRAKVAGRTGSQRRRTQP